MPRARLPDRRPLETRTIAHGGHKLHVSIGFDPASGEPREVFGSLDTSTTSEMAMLVQDACVIVSLALQHGAAPGDLAKSLGRVPVWTPDGEGTAPASLIGTIVGVLTEVEPYPVRRAG